MCTHATTRAALLLGPTFLAGCAGLRSVPAETPEERAALATELVPGSRAKIKAADGSTWEGVLVGVTAEKVHLSPYYDFESLSVFVFHLPGELDTDPDRTIESLDATPPSYAKSLFRPLLIKTAEQRRALEGIDEANLLFRVTTVDGERRIAQVHSVITDSPGGIRGSYYSTETDEYFEQEFYFAGEPAQPPEVTIASLVKLNRVPQTDWAPRYRYSSEKRSVGDILISGAVAILLLPLAIIKILTLGLL